ncbi:hypothetical protein OUZ56_013578 [Daphnia magna]|uniref:Secreted protein n=1 Tax=Daphnia magna TaxID=35525 RepID=A0ABQ9Z6A0_9CRUS|nr:hypothetical protein OUZ56_013578 [Daphnia magna]
MADTKLIHFFSFITNWLSAAFPLYSSRSQAVQSTEDHSKIKCNFFHRTIPYCYLFLPFAEMLACCDFRPRVFVTFNESISSRELMD